MIKSSSAICPRGQRRPTRTRLHCCEGIAPAQRNPANCLTFTIPTASRESRTGGQRLCPYKLSKIGVDDTPKRKGKRDLQTPNSFSLAHSTPKSRHDQPRRPSEARLRSLVTKRDSERYDRRVGHLFSVRITRGRMTSDGMDGQGQKPSFTLYLLVEVPIRRLHLERLEKRPRRRDDVAIME